MTALRPLCRDPRTTDLDHLRRRVLFPSSAAGLSGAGASVSMGTHRT